MEASRPWSGILPGLQWSYIQNQVGGSFCLLTLTLLTAEETELSRAHFNFSQEPFAITAFGMTFYLVTEVKQSAAVYKNTETLSFEGFVQGLMRTNGNSEHAISTMYADLPRDKAGFPNLQGESLGCLAQKMHIYQLHPGHGNLIHLQQKVRAWIDSRLNLDTFQRACHYAVSQSSRHVEVPLYQWASKLFVQLGQEVYFGATLGKIDPEVPNNFLIFDELIWKVLYQYPGFLSQDMARGRAKVVAALTQYFQKPRAERDDAAWLIKAMEDEMRALGVGVEDMAIIVFHLYIA